MMTWLTTAATNAKIAREVLMNRQGFEAQLVADGYREIETKFLHPRPANDQRGHPYAARGLVLSGAFAVILDGTVTTYGPGDLFLFEAGLNHAEQVGSDGAKIVEACKY